MRLIKAADLFCGAGGTSSGLIRACQRMGYGVDLTAINHWDIAVATHTANHPEARHLCTSLDDVNPRSLYEEGELDILWASPECTHHSVARGGRPINDQSRATAWCVVRWADAVRPSIILVENVPEFESWGGICVNGRPMKSKKGATFLAWVSALESLGYRVDWRVLCAADYGDPTTRRRLFVQAVRGKRRIVWPEPTHAPIGEADLLGSRKPWVAAREVIDWNIVAQSIYERKKGLSENTLRRIFEGLKKFGLKPFIIPQQSNPTPKDVDDPMPTICAEGSGPKLAQPFLVCMEHGGNTRDIDRPMPTITTAKGGAIGVVEPFVMSAGGPECAARPVSQPMGTVLTRDHRALVEPFLVELRGTTARQIEQTSRSIDEPLPTVTSGGGHAGLVSPFLVQVAHGNGTDKNGDKRRARAITKPLPTVCGNRGEWAVCEPSLLQQQSGGVLRPVSEPAPTVATTGAIGLVEPFLVSYYGNGNAQSVKEPMDTVTTKDRFGLVEPMIVEIEGQRYKLDIRFRMLQPHELAAAQGFPTGYQFVGNKTQQVKQIGNAVPGNLSEAIVRAVLMQNPNVS